MFENILSEFTDFPQVEVSFYHETSTYDPNTGQMVTGYNLDYAKDVWGFQKSAMHGFMRDKFFDDVDLMLILDDLPPKEDLLYYDGQWYSIAFPDDIGFGENVYTIGCKRVEKPNLLGDEPEDITVVGETGGIG